MNIFFEKIRSTLDTCSFHLFQNISCILEQILGWQIALYSRMAPRQLASFCCSRRIWECNGLGTETHESTELLERKHLTTLQWNHQGQVCATNSSKLCSLYLNSAESSLSISCGIPSVMCNFGESDKLQNPKMAAGQDLKSQLVLVSAGKKHYHILSVRLRRRTSCPSKPSHVNSLDLYHFSLPNMIPCMWPLIRIHLQL